MHEESMFRINFQPMNIEVFAKPGTTILEAEKMAGISQDSPCGGHGICRKCRVSVAGERVLACQKKITSDMTVLVERTVENSVILTQGIEAGCEMEPVNKGALLAAIDIGTTTIVCYLLEGSTGKELAVESMLNPQHTFGADVISRIQSAQKGNAGRLADVLRKGLAELIQKACVKTGFDSGQIGVVSIVGNPAMQQLFLGLSTKNLSAPPFAAVLTHTEVREARELLPDCENAQLLVVPDIAGYVGADTVGCLLSTRLYQEEELSLLLDIGTNGEMILGNKDDMVSCSTAAGPALEGARITCGLRGVTGAVDHVWISDGEIRFSTIGRKKAAGICGSGLIDMVAVLLDLGILNKRGRIVKDYQELEGERVIPLTDEVYLTQNDIREVQMAKGAIAAGIELLTEELHADATKIRRVFLAGAFGSYITSQSACRIGLIPPFLQNRIQVVGNAAGSGGKMMACSRKEFFRTDALVKMVRSVELATLPKFQQVFAKNMMFMEQ